MGIWQKIPVSLKELNLSNTLQSGQAFRWRVKKQQTPQGLLPVWNGVIKGMAVGLFQTEEELYFCRLATISRRGEDLEAQIRDYFNLDKLLLEPLYEIWKGKCPIFREKSAQRTGIRILRQDPVETLLSFICSSNNIIPRIKSLVDKLCTNFGESMTPDDDVVGEEELTEKVEEGKEEWWSFPEIEKLAKIEDLELKLRNLGFGYRAKYLKNTVQKLNQLDLPPSDWLSNLRQASYEVSKEALMQFPGVGPKVADCVCLMALDKHQVVPVDTHVWQMALDDFALFATEKEEGKKRRRKTPTLNDKLYREIQEGFTNLYGPYAGWAHSLLFITTLKSVE